MPQKLFVGPAKPIKSFEYLDAAGPPWTSRDDGAEEHSHRALKQLISCANRQWEIAGTINSTNTSPGKGWTCPDEAYLRELTAA